MERDKWSAMASDGPLVLPLGAAAPAAIAGAPTAGTDAGTGDAAASAEAAVLHALRRLLRPDDAAARAQEMDRRLSTALAMQGQIIEALLAEKDQQDAAAAEVAARLARAEAFAEGAGARIDRLEARNDDVLGGALGECSARLSEVLLHLDAAALDRLPAGGRPLHAALRGLSEQIAALDARLPPPPGGDLSSGDPAGGDLPKAGADPEAEPPEAMRLAVAQALAPEGWKGEAA